MGLCKKEGNLGVWNAAYALVESSNRRSSVLLMGVDVELIGVFKWHLVIHTSAGEMRQRSANIGSNLYIIQGR